MPYNPGIQDRSGDYLAQGIGQLGEGIQRGMMSYMQNKTMASQALGKFEATLQANPDILKFLNPEEPSPNAPSDVVKAYMKLQKDGSLGVRDASMLSTFADTYTKAKEDKQQAEMRQMQMAHMAQQQAQAQQQQAAEDQMNARMQQMAQLGQQQQQGVGGGVLRPEVSQTAQDFINTKAGYLASQGVRMTPAQMVDLAKTDQNAQSREAIARAKLQGGPIKLDKYRLDADGKTYEVTIDANTNREIARGTIKEPPRAYPTADESGAIELAKTSGSERAKNAVAHLQAVSDAAEGAQDTLARIGQVRKLYEAGEVTGSGQGVMNEITGAAVRLGIYPRGKQGTKEALQSALAMDALQNARTLMKGQGSVSDKEREAIEKVSAGVGKTPEANLAILAIGESLANRSLEQEKKRRELYDSGMDPVKITEQLKRWRMDNPLPAFNIPKDAATATAPKLPSGWKVN